MRKHSQNSIKRILVYLSPHIGSFFSVKFMIAIDCSGSENACTVACGGALGHLIPSME
jgi:hypothetical protein